MADRTGAAKPRYAYPPNAREISGMGGGYEAACRAMVIAGLEWWDAHPDARPSYRGLENVMGICIDNNDDAREMDKVILAAVEDCTGAMHQAAIETIMWVRKNGWAKYIETMTRPREA